MFQLPNTQLEWKFRLLSCVLFYGRCQEVELSTSRRYVDTATMKRKENDF